MLHRGKARTYWAPLGILTPRNFARAALKVFVEHDINQLSAYRSETMLFVVQTQLFWNHLFEQGQTTQFLDELKALCESEDAPEGMYDTLMGNFFASAALVPKVMSKAIDKDRKREIARAIAAQKLGMTKDLAERIKEHAFVLTKALRAFYSTGTVAEDCEKAFSDYLYSSFLMVEVAVHGGVPVIRGFDADYIMSCGVNNPTKALYIAEFMSAITHEISLALNAV